MRPLGNQAGCESGYPPRMRRRVSFCPLGLLIHPSDRRGPALTGWGDLIRLAAPGASPKRLKGRRPMGRFVRVSGIASLALIRYRLRHLAAISTVEVGHG